MTFLCAIPCGRGNYFMCIIIIKRRNHPNHRDNGNLSDYTSINVTKVLDLVIWGKFYEVL